MKKSHIRLACPVSLVLVWLPDQCYIGRILIKECINEPGLSILALHFLQGIITHCLLHILNHFLTSTGPLAFSTCFFLPKEQKQLIATTENPSFDSSAANLFPL